MTKVLKIPVTEFALPVPRQGSIEVNSGYGLLAQDAPESHYALQKLRMRTVAGYKPEVRVSHKAASGPYEFVISGRADGVFELNGTLVVEEIKTSIDPKELVRRLTSDPNHPYCLQLRSYGYFLMLEAGLVVEPTLSFLVASLCDGSVVELPIALDRLDFERWLERRLIDLEGQTKHRLDRESRRKKMVDTLKFPFQSMRKGQEKLMQFIESSAEGSAPVMVQAPTGLGKTMAVLYPTLKDSLSRGQRLVYVTPKNSQHGVASEAVEHLRKTSKIKSLVLTAKSKMCLKEQQICHPDYCEFARDYYKKVYEHDLAKKIGRKSQMTAGDFMKYGKKYSVCPFELSIDTLAEADVIIGDYNYVFSPTGLLGRLSAPDARASERPNLVVDEAHNLPARSMGYYSGAISSSSLRALKANLESAESCLLADECIALVEQAAKARTVLTVGKQSLTGAADNDCADKFVQIELRLRGLLAKHIASSGRTSSDALVELLNLWSQFTSVVQLKGDQFFKTGRSGGGAAGSTLKVTCSDASDKLKKIYDSFFNVVLFSATLKPFEYYATLSGLDFEKTKTSEFTSPFPKRNRLVMVIPQVSTIYEDRTKNYGKIKDAIRRIISQRPGNYFVFAPSFAFLQNISEIAPVAGFRVLTQEPDMKLPQVNEYLRMLRSVDEPTIIFAVQGGVFSEGVDYPGESLIGAIVVGPSLPMFDEERERMRAYYESRYGSGFDFAYVYPAMSRVVQSAGRVIRSEQDRGLIILMDGRFLSQRYAKAMPCDWYDDTVRELVSNRILSDIQEFWRSDA